MKSVGVFWRLLKAKALAQLVDGDPRLRSFGKHLRILHVAEVSVRAVEQPRGRSTEGILLVRGVSVISHPVEVDQVDGRGACELGLVGTEGLGERTLQLLPGITASLLAAELQLGPFSEAAEVETGCRSVVGSCDPELLEHLVAGGDDLVDACRLSGKLGERALA